MGGSFLRCQRNNRLFVRVSLVLTMRDDCKRACCQAKVAGSNPTWGATKIAVSNLAFAGDPSCAFELVCFTLIRRVNPRRFETDICDFGQPSGMADPSASIAG